MAHGDESVYLKITKDEDGRYSFSQSSISSNGSAQSDDIAETDTGTTAAAYFGITDGK